MPRLIVIETALEGVTGHFLQYAAGMALAAPALGLDAQVFANCRYAGDAPPAGVSIRPWFRRPMHPQFSHAQGAAAFAEELERLVQSEELGAADWICVNTTSGRHLDGLVTYQRRRGAGPGPFILVLLMFDPAQAVMDEVPERPLRAILADLAASGFWPAHGAGFGLSPALAAAYSALSAVRVHAAPLAVRTQGIVDLRPVSPPRPLNLGMIGEARPEKGIGLLPGLAQSLLQSHGRTGQLRFTVQTATTGYEAQVAPVAAALQRLPPDFMTLIDTPPAADAYYRTLGETDIVLCPYVGDYRLKVSAVLTEALCAGKPAVVPAGSSLAELLPPDCGVAFASPADLRTALLRVVDGYDAYRAAALARAPVLRRIHSFEHVLGLMLAAAAEQRCALHGG